jgi:hypothetical protein
VNTLREKILGADDIRREPVEVPEWPGVGPIYVRVMTSGQRDRIEEAYRKSTVDWFPLVVVTAACDADGKPIFTEADVAALCNKSGEAIRRVAKAAADLNWLSKDKIEEAEGNSDAIPSASPSTGSPNDSA